MTSRDLPKLCTVGVREQHDRLPEDQVPLLAVELPAAGTLGSIQDFVFFSPALLYVVVAPAYDPYFHFLDQYAHEARPVCCTFVDPIIRGFRGSAASWHYQLWGLQREHWQAYREFMSTAAFSDRATGLLSRVRFMSLDIVDPLARRRQVILPSRPVLAKVEAMVLDTNFGVAYFQPAVSDKIWQEPPSVAFSSNVCPGARDFAAAWFSGKSDPYSEASSYPFSEEPPFLGT